MAAKRVATSSVNFAEVAAKIPESRRATFNALRASNENLVRKINGLPAEKPKIDWAMYKAKINPAIVDDFQKKYDALAIPYPNAEAELAQVEAERKKMEAEHNKFVQESNQRMEEYKKEIAAWQKLGSVSNLTMSNDELLAYGLGGAGGYLSDWKSDQEEAQLWPYDQDFKEWRRISDEIAVVEEENYQREKRGEQPVALPHGAEAH